jgi:hypothetical protein
MDRDAAVSVIHGRADFLGTVRLALLLAVLIFVALGAWLDRRRSTDWDAHCG